MKKLLALVLALVMTMSLVTISNAAFDDADDIDYNEAVDVMNAVGVLVGSDGKFNPQDNLTRAQACKIIAYLDLGGKTADAIKGSGAVFSDVPATAWYAGYVEYCAGAGYVAGVGGGKFDPDANVTGIQFAKMLLCALGYDASIEGYTGADYTLSIARDANKIDLFKALSIATSAALTREQAAQMALNALKADTVKYEGGTSVSTSDGTTVTVNSRRENITGAKNYNGNGDGKEQLVEKLYGSDLKLAPSADEFGTPANVWTYKGNDVGTYAKSADKELKGEITKGDMYNAIGSAAYKKLGAWAVYENGKDVSATYTSSVCVEKNSDTVIKVSNVALAGNGSLTKVFVDYNSGTERYDVTICVIDTFLGKVSSVIAAEGANDRKVSITEKSETLTNLDKDYETESFAKNDYVLYTAYTEDSGTTYAIASMTKAPAVVTAKVSSVQGTSNFVAGGETYKYSNVKAGTLAVGNIGDEVDIYCDAEGYVLLVEATAASADLSKYLVVYNQAYATALDTDVIANAITLDGTKLSGITLGKVDGVAVTLTNQVSEKVIYAFSTNKDGEYNLTAVGAPYDAASGSDVAYTKGSTSFGSYVVNNDTKFVVYNEAKKTVSTYDGIGEMTKLINTGVYKLANDSKFNYFSILHKDDSTTAKAVFVYATTKTVASTSTGKDLVYILSTNYVTTLDEDDNNVYTYDAIVNGVVGKVATQDLAICSVLDTVGLYYISSYDGEYIDGVVFADRAGNAPTDYAVVQPYANRGYSDAVKVSIDGGVLTLSNTVYGDAYAYSLADDTFAYSITSKGVATETTIDALTADSSKNTFVLVLKKVSDIWYADSLYMQK